MRKLFLLLVFATLLGVVCTSAQAQGVDESSVVIPDEPPCSPAIEACWLVGEGRYIRCEVPFEALPLILPCRFPTDDGWMRPWDGESFSDRLVWIWLWDENVPDPFKPAPTATPPPTFVSPLVVVSPLRQPTAPTASGAPTAAAAQVRGSWSDTGEVWFLGTRSYALYSDGLGHYCVPDLAPGGCD